MNKIVVVFHSGYGHTKKQAEAIVNGLKEVNGADVRLVEISENGNIGQDAWEHLDSSSCIIFGSPTYMGSVSWQFKKFADESSKQWSGQKWKDKIAAGFTNSASINGDKQSTIDYLNTFAMQHSMVWVGTGLMPSNTKNASRGDVNYLGAFKGLMAQSPSDSTPEEGPLPGDLETAMLFGQRLAEISEKWQKMSR